MSAAEVHPFAPLQPLVKLRQHVVEGTLQNVGVLFAHSVEVNAVQTVKAVLFHLFQRYTHAGTGNAGIVQIGFYFCIAGIDANAAGNIPGCILHLLPVFFPLSKRVEYNMVAEFQQLCEIFLRVGRGEHMHFFPEVLSSQFCLE